jgi:tetratricopeptide (TPR) repeat protein
MDITLAQRAVDLALEGNWKEAIEVNDEILRQTPDDIDALNRKARALAELGDIAKARKVAEEVIKLDPINSIAIKCLEKWKKMTKVRKENDKSISVVDAFLEESGKTKLVKLIHTGDESVFANLDPGEEVKLVPFAHRVSAMTMDGTYLGRLPDDLANRLKTLIKEGNKYQVLVKSVGNRDLVVFIREIERGKKVKDINSFPPEKIDYVAFTPPELVHSDTPINIGEGLEDAEGSAHEP